MIRKAFLIGLLSSFFITTYAHFMSKVWPQKDFEAKTIGKETAMKKVLIATKMSSFRTRVVNDVISKIKADSVYIEITDLKKIKDVEPSQWNVIVLMNRCVAWDYDNLVRDFVESHPTYKSIFVLTTSGDANGCFSEKKKDRLLNVDGISCASEESKIPSVVTKIDSFIRNNW